MKNINYIFVSFYIKKKVDLKIPAVAKQYKTLLPVLLTFNGLSLENLY